MVVYAIVLRLVGKHHLSIYSSVMKTDFPTDSVIIEKWHRNLIYQVLFVKTLWDKLYRNAGMIHSIVEKKMKFMQQQNSPRLKTHHISFYLLDNVSMCVVLLVHHGYYSQHYLFTRRILKMKICLWTWNISILISIDRRKIRQRNNGKSWLTYMLWWWSYLTNIEW